MINTRQLHTILFIDNYRKDYKKSPTLEIIGRNFGISRQGVAERLKPLKIKGYIDYNDNKELYITKDGLKAVEDVNTIYENQKKREELEKCIKAFKRMFPTQYNKLIKLNTSNLFDENITENIIKTDEFLNFIYGDFKVILKGNKIIDITMREYLLGSLKETYKAHKGILLPNNKKIRDMHELFLQINK